MSVLVLFIPDQLHPIKNTVGVLINASMKKQPLHPRWGKNPRFGSKNPRRFFFFTNNVKQRVRYLVLSYQADTEMSRLIMVERRGVEPLLLE